MSWKWNLEWLHKGRRDVILTYDGRHDALKTEKLLPCLQAMTSNEGRYSLFHLASKSTRLPIVVVLVYGMSAQ